MLLLDPKRLVKGHGRSRNTIRDPLQNLTLVQIEAEAAIKFKIGGLEFGLYCRFKWVDSGPAWGKADCNHRPTP
jgi:hypothetical protein